MKKQFLLIGLLCFLVLPLTYIGCTSKKPKENNAALLTANRDSIRQAEQAAAELAAQQAQMEALAAQEETTHETVTPQYSGYYVILGSFRDQNNAQTFLEAMAEVFPDETTGIYNHHSWKMVTLGNKFGTFSSAKSTWQHAKEALQGYDYENLSFGDEGYEEDYEDQGGGLPQEEDEEYTEDYDEEYSDEEYTDESYGDSSPFYTPWILAVY